MNLKCQKVLFFTRTMMMGGTENVILQLCEILKPKVEKIVVCSCGGINVNFLNNMGIKHYQIPDIEQKTAKVIIQTMKELLHIVKNEDITVIHTHHRMAAFYVRVLGLNKRCIFINTSHNIFTNRKKLTFFAYRKAHLIACGEAVKQNLVDTFGLPDCQVKIIYNAIKPFNEPIIEDDIIKDLHDRGYFLVGNIGRLTTQKGFEYFISSIPGVIAIHPKTHFLIIGEGEDEHKLRKLVNNLKIDTYVTFLGYRANIQGIMTQLDLVVLSSLWEGLPLTPIEAFSVGKTIVATAVDGTVEIVEDMKSGLLVNPGCAEEITDKVNWMIDHPKQKEKMELIAREQYNRKFSFQCFSEAYCSFYEEVCK